jgi:nitroreductase/NAD-dependent dihydropyrimidine dehydrogenase PreA subunit
LKRDKTTKRELNPPEVTTEKCTGCGFCIEVCPAFVIDLIEEKAVVARGEWCIGCAHCGAVCPTGAILQKAAIEDWPQTGLAASSESLQRLLRQRRSVRVYGEKPVSQEILNKILDAGRYAPTGMNSQNVHYLVLSSPGEIEKLREMTIIFYEKIFSRAKGRLGAFVLSLIAGRKVTESLRESLPKLEYAKEQMKQGKDPLFYRAPALMLAHAESWDTCSAFNCSVALYNCSLMAHTLGVGCCFNWYLVNAVNHDRRIKQGLAIPADHGCFGAMTLGYQDIRYERLVNREPPKVRWR